jgi:hypothetical protein
MKPYENMAFIDEGDASFGMPAGEFDTWHDVLEYLTSKGVDWMDDNDKRLVALTNDGKIIDVTEHLAAELAANIDLDLVTDGNDIQMPCWAECASGFIQDRLDAEYFEHEHNRSLRPDV